MADLFISVGDYVLLQEGQADQPKIIVWDDLSIDSSLAVGSVVPISVFDTVVTEDPVQPSLVQSIALVVFDNVRVQEGQVDSGNLDVSIIDLVTLAESVSGSMSSLAFSVNEVVSVVDAPSVFAQGPLGAIVFDAVTVQEFSTPYLLIQINAFELVAVIDGAMEVSANDTVTVDESVVLKVAWLLVDTQETVTITEAVSVEGPAINVSFLVFEDLILDDAVVMLLASVPTSVVDGVSVAESVTVSISSIDLEVDIFDAVTIAESHDQRENPIQLIEFTQVIVDDAVTVLSDTLLITQTDTIAVADGPTLVMSLVLLDVADAVTVNERIALRIGKGGRKRRGLLTVGAGE